ncbi:MAG: condensation domain-containing protein [Cellvibrionales bacterium]|nr:condensation domain-containing protein [Cellvibrionales bacterium]
MERDKITLINCAPSALYALLDVTQSEMYNKLASLRWILLGGEPIQTERIQAFFEAHPHCQLVNMYGPTEATDISTCYQLAPHEFGDTVPIGKAIPGVATYILDSHQRFLPEGAIGELYIGGSNLAKGYYGQDEQTAKQFIWHEGLEQRLYRTGDLVRLKADGHLVFEGRADHQVKIRGFRIELGEITHQLQSIAGVHQAIVTDRLSPVTHQTCLVAYAAVDSDLDNKSMHNELTRLLPDYMIPEKLVLMSSLPLNANGKIDRQALPEPDWAIEHRELILPQNDDQTHLLAIWQQVLEIENISIDDSFFAIGGHSLKGAQLLGRIRDRFKVDINLQEIFANDSIEKQAALIEQKQLQPVVIPPLTQAPKDSPKVLSYAQQRLWLLTQVTGNNPAYNMPAAWYIKGELNTQALSLAINAMVERHESLRLVFSAIDGEPQVEVLPAQNSPIQLVTFDVGDREQAEKLVQVSLTEGFDLASGQLLRVELYKLGTQSNLLAMNMHHIISDGHSIQVLLRELMTFYHGFATQQMVDIAPLPFQYTDYAYWQRNWLQGEVLDKEIAWWRQTLKGVTEILPMPLDHPRPKVQNFEGASFRMVLSEQISKKIASTSLEQNVTPFMLMLAAYHTLLHKFAQHDDIAVGVPLAGRSIDGLEKQIGFFINAVVIRAHCGANYRLDEFMQLIKTQVLNAFAHEYVPIEMLLNELGIERHLGVTPVVQCAFNMMVADNSPQQPQSFEGLSIEPLHQESTVAKFDLQLNALQEEDKMILSMDYNTAIFERSTIVQLMEAYAVLLEYFCLQPGTTFERIELKSSDKNHWLPLTPMQRDIYLSAITRTDTLENSLGYAMHLPIVVDTDLFQESIIEIHRHFVALNTKVVTSQGLFDEMAYLAFDLDLPIDYAFIDCRNDHLSMPEIEAKLQATVMHPYDLESSSLVQYRLYQFAEDHFWFTFANHHLISDGFSAVVHLNHLTHLYEQKVNGVSTLITTADHFIDYIAESRTTFDRPDTLAFWQEQLKACEPLQTFVAVQQTTQQTREDKLLTLPVPIEHYLQIKTFCRKNKITPALYFKSLYALLISWYTRAEGDFVLTEFNGGRDKSNKDTMGCFYHTQPSLIPLEALQGELSELFGALRKRQKLTKNYLQISPRLLNQCLPDSEIGFSYNYLMLPHHYPMLGQDFTGHRYTPNAEGMVDFRVQADGDDVHLWLAFNSAHFDDNRFLERLLALSTQCIEGVDHNNAFDYRLNDEKAVMIESSITPSLSVIECLEQQAERHAQHMAVWDIDKALTYDQFNRHVNQVAHALIKQGVMAGDHVLVHLPPGCDFVIALWGVIKSGGCYVPMDHHYPPSRVEHIRNDAKAKITIDGEFLAQTLEMPTHNPKVTIDTNTPFYTLYTSGSTGKPKGATVTHSNENHLIQWYRACYKFGLETNVLVISSMGFDLTQKNLIAPLCAGSSVLMPTTDAFDPEVIITAIEQRDANVMNCAPSALYTLIEHPRGINALSNMRTILLGGEPISPNRIAPLVQSPLYQADLINMYGPTECTDITTAKKYPAAELKQRLPETFSLGDAIEGVEVTLVDHAHRPVPHGLIGEIAISGMSLGLGYWQQMELTQQAFYEKNGKRYYLTGDLAYRDHQQADKPLIYVGRKDFQVKLNGRRIELNEIQHSINQLPEVQDSRLIVINDELIGFVLTQSSIDNHQKSWRSQLAAELPAFMIPKRLHALTHFPLNANGKVDRNQLMQMDVQLPVSIEAEPSTDTEMTLSQLWQEVLGMPVAVNENFFSAGGDSLTAIRLIAKIELHFAIKLPVASLFNAQTIEEQAQLIEQEQQGFSPLVCINKGKEDVTPIFAFHALGGMVLSYQPLAIALGDDQPFYGIQAYGFEDNQTPFTNLDNMVDFYLESIEAQYDGDYQLIGHSFGGLIALEAARKLVAKGKKVTYLGLIDTHPPVGYLGMAVDDAFILKTFVEHNFGKVDLPLSKLRILPKDKMIEKVVEGLNGLVDAAFIERAIAVIHSFQQQMTGYKLKPLEVPIELFRSQEAMESFGGRLKGKFLKDKAHTLGFHKISNDFTLTQVPGDHYTMLSEYADALAGALTKDE